MLLVDVLNPDAMLVSPAQKSHSCSRSSVDRPLHTPPKKNGRHVGARRGEFIMTEGLSSGRPTRRVR